MSEHVLLLQVSIALLLGLLMTRAFKYTGLNLPDVTAYLIAGVIIGPYLLGALNIEGIGLNTMAEVEHLKIISDVALGFIAFAIGNEFRLSELKNIGKKATIIGIFQALVATLLVDAVLVIVSLTTGILSISNALILGAIASATAPAATLMVVRQYKAKGNLTDLLLPIVALDDAVGLIIFAISFGIAEAVETSQLSYISLIVDPLFEICGSLILGVLLGYVLTILEKMFFSNKNRVALSIGFVFLSITLSSTQFMLGDIHVRFSSLLVNMMMGTALCNMCERSADIMERCDKWTTPLCALFFILSGAELELSIFSNYQMILLGLVYIVVRAAGKYLGTYVSAKATGCDEMVCRYLGITLFPQAGVALGMVAQVSANSTGDTSIVRNVVLFAVMVYELVGPSLTRMALHLAGEIKEKEESTKTHERFNKPKVA
ncbi:MAG: cation:proton antiporter [Erysipelotrichaceae bacterium]|nr:cation:proton antiporter [Erysipelotrichaceae bacterium]